MKGADTVDSVQHGLRRALRHLQLKVYYWMPDRSQFVGPGGVVTRSLDSYLDPQVIRVCTDDGDLLGAVLVEDEPVINDQLRKSIQGVCRLAMSNTRLEAELRLQLKENADARARIVTSSLQERRRLERDMHDGAQQRLLGVGMLLSVAEQAASGDLQLLVQRIQAELDQALGELRDLAHGIYPELLERYGLKAALEHVIIRLPLNIDTYVDDRRWPPEVEGAVYFSTCEALSNTCKHAGATTAWLSIHDENGSVDVKIGDNGRGSPSLNERGALPNIRDRVDSMAGTLMVRSGPGGTHIHLRIPNPAPLHH